MNTLTDKAVIRRQMRMWRQTLAPDWVVEHGRRIQAQVERLREWAEARTVCCYLAMGGEVPTRELIRACQAEGKRVWVPAWREAEARYGLALWREDVALCPGLGGVLEPVDPQWSPGEPVEVVGVPGVAFDRNGGRLGHGRGHYDQLLAAPALRGAFKLGLAFESQVLDQVPMDRHDVPMDGVVTEQSDYRCVKPK